jgi:DNA polymerase-1
MSKERVYLIDATAFCYRAFYALSGLATSFGQPTNAIYGFFNILNKILKAQKPEYLAVCFDVSRDTFRARKFAEYKIQRPPMPDGLSSQIPLIKDIIRAYGFRIYEKEGFEADDIIASLAKKAKAKGRPVVIVSSDKDILQLVDDQTTVLSPQKEESITYDEKKVRERFGVGPERVTDIIALMGDDADNIPGVPGVGEKTAASLIAEFGSLDELLKNVEGIRQEKIKEAVKDNLEQIKLSKELAELQREVDIDFDLKDLLIGEPDTKELFRIFKHLEFRKFLKDLQPPQEPAAQIKVEALEDEELKGDKITELIVSGGSLHDLVLGALGASSAKTRFLRVNDPASNIKSVLQDPKIRKAGHDLKNLRLALAKEGIVISGLYFDTMVAAYLLNPSKPSYSLNDVAGDYLGVFLGDQNIEPQNAADLIARLRPKLEKELQEKDLWRLFCDLEMPLVEVLAEMELNGIRLDLEVLEHLSRDIEKRLIHLIDEIYRESGSQFNINSTLQLRDILFTRLKLPVIKKGKTGPSTDEEVLRKLADKHKLPQLLLEYRQLTKLKNTYIDALPELIDKTTGKIHTSFNQTGTETGRLSSSNPNLQNIPVKTDIGRHIRRAIIATDKNYLISCDYSQVELRILAHLSKDKFLTESFKKDKDIHKATAALIYGVQEQDVNDAMREVAKRVNFGIIYGLTSYGLSRDLGISTDEAQGFIDSYFSKYPEVKDYIEEQKSKAKKCGFVTTILGRRRYLPEINSKNMMVRQFAERQAVNTPIQGTASDLIKLAMVDIHKESSVKKLKSKMILQIHDELLFDVVPDETQELVGLIKDRMEHALKLDVPVKVDIKKGKNWLEMEPV